MNSSPKTLYRVVDSRFSVREALSGEGARIAGGRWNQKNKSVVYCSETGSLAMLEKLTAIAHEVRGKVFQLLSIHFSRESFGGIREVSPKELPKNWQEYPDPPDTRELGTKLLEEVARGGEEEAANYIKIIAVPSVICPIEKNFLVDPLIIESLLKQVGDLKEVVEVRKFTFDERIL